MNKILLTIFATFILTNIVAELFIKDNPYSEMIAVKDAPVNKVGVDTLAQAKEVAKKSKGGDVIIFDKQKKKYFTYACILSNYNYRDARQAETSDHGGMDFQIDFSATPHLLFISDEGYRNIFGIKMCKISP